MLALVCVKQSDMCISISIVCIKRSNSFISILLHNIKKVLLCLNFKQIKSWTLISLMKNIVIVLNCTKYSKLIVSEENIISVQQLTLCPPLFFKLFLLKQFEVHLLQIVYTLRNYLH